MPRAPGTIDLTGNHFGRLTVIGLGAPKIQNGRAHERQWACQCSCGNPELYLATTSNLLKGAVKSCGCLRRENSHDIRRRHNHYEFKDGYVVGYTHNTSEPFVFDTELYELVSQYCWYSEHGYVQTSPSYKTQKIYLHRLITGAAKADVIDHINHNKRDNRLCNLRITTHGNNTRNRLPGPNSISGVSGVTWHADLNRWVASIGLNHRTKHLGCFTDLSAAITARKAAEDKYYGEFSYNNSMRIAPPVPPELLTTPVAPAASASPAPVSTSHNSQPA